MSHEIESMMYVGKTPWHGLGVKLDTAPTGADAIRHAGLDSPVELVPLCTADTGVAVDYRATRRTSDGAIHGFVSPDYKILQNVDAFAFFDPFIVAGEAQLHTAGSLRQGKRVWILAKLQRAPMVIVPGDEVEKYILLSNSHDGTQAIRVGLTPTRVVCANTLRMAHESKASSLIRVRHTGNVTAALDDVRDVMNLANAQFEATAEQYRQLARRGCNAADLKKYVQLVFPDTNVDSKRSRVMGAVERLFVMGRGIDRPGVRGTYWAAYNAVNEYLGYERGRDAGARLDTLWFGEGAVINARALTTAVEMASA